MYAKCLSLVAFISMAIAFTLSANTPFDDFITAYEKYGGGKYMIDEEIVQSAHVLQAAYLARLCGAPEDVVIGLLLHDVGQVIDPLHVGNVPFLHAVHDEIGGRWLADNGFPSDVADWVRFHTVAKVVLCMEDPSYYDHLSLASKQSYLIQRDKYFNEEGQHTLCAFNQHPRREDFLRQRKCDDMAKIIDFEHVGTLEAYREMVVRVVQGRGAAAASADWREQVDALHAFMCRNRSAFEELIRSGWNPPQ